MLKNKLDFKLVNLALLVFSGYLIYQTKDFCFDILKLILKISLPFIIAFAIAYALYPVLKYFESKKIPKGVGVIMVIALVIGIFALAIGLVIPVVFGQLSSLFNGIITFITNLSNNFDLDLGPLQETLTKTFNEIIASVGSEVQKLENMGKNPIVITSPIVRIYFKRLTEDYYKDLIVVSYNEIESNVELQSVGMVTA